MSDEISPDAVRSAHALRVAVGRLRRRLREVGDGHELTPSQTSVLSRLARGPSTASALAAEERIRPQSMATTLTALEGQGLITRRPDPTDGRRQLVELSEVAVEVIRGAREQHEEWLARALQDRYTPAERARLAEAFDLLDRLT
ncbi:MarR family winged helix-turn-helix transcriptional regulator [Actinokineospora sp. G85]|uniref:MarR family winged helix-turn-helix transcriptional regulator n=1 Tax=Actinokineospora sp. G85 TaxID=3406626 RepID=UPI003C70CDF6